MAAVFLLLVSNAQADDPPTEIYQVYATPASATSALITWNLQNDNTGVDHYEISRGLCGNDSLTLLETVGSTTTSYVDSDRANTVCYIYGVVVVDELAHSGSIWHRASLTMPAGPSLKKPIYVDQTWGGTDGQPYTGTPGVGVGYHTLQAAVDNIIPGDTIYLRGGVHQELTNLPSNRNGSSWNDGEFNTITSYPGEWAILDGGNNVNANYKYVIGVNFGTGYLAYWKIERLEVRNGSTADGTGAHGLSLTGIFSVRYCYIHDNVATSYDNYAGLYGAHWTDAIVEYNVFKNNGCPTQGNSTHMGQYTDYNATNISNNGFVDLGIARHDTRNEIRYNLFLGGSNHGYKEKMDQYFSSRSVWQDADFKTYGNNIHHNVFLNLDGSAIVADQDYTQIHNNIIANSGGGIVLGDDPLRKPVVYNNTIVNTAGDAMTFLNSPGSSHLPLLNPYYGYAFNNIADGDEVSGANWTSEEYTVWATTTNPSKMYFKNNYSYRPVSNGNDPAGTYMFWAGPYNVCPGVACRYTIARYKSEIDPSATNWMNAYDAGNLLYRGVAGTDLYRTVGTHSLGDGLTIANGGIGGTHPYLDGVGVDGRGVAVPLVTIPSYVGATNPNDDAWVAGVLGLEATSTLMAASSNDPGWIEGAGPDITAPSIPTGLTATAISSSRINLFWTASADAVGVSGYRVYRNSIQIATSTGTSYSSTGLSASTQYSYTVSAFDAARNFSAQSSAVSATTQAAPVVAPPSGGGSSGGGSSGGSVTPVVPPVVSPVATSTGQTPEPETTPPAAANQENQTSVSAPATLSGASSATVNQVTAAEAAIISSRTTYVNFSTGSKISYDKLMAQISVPVTNEQKAIVANFIQSGTPTTLVLGAGERAGSINSFRSAFTRLPASTLDWQDVIKIGNGRWTTQRSATAEAKAKISFKKIYLREPNMANAKDNAAVTVMAYGLRPAQRNMNSEKAAINSFKYIFHKIPVSAADWDIVRAIAYSGAKR
ncbi:MAG: hypothetical protein PHE24_02435 [Patescibacteria group bacterium]|nr:hypothetical protein [Patescibacteria group bacterium]